MYIELRIFSKQNTYVYEQYLLKLTPKTAFQNYLETDTVWLLGTNNCRQNGYYMTVEDIC